MRKRPERLHRQPPSKPAGPFLVASGTWSFWTSLLGDLVGWDLAAAAGGDLAVGDLAAAAGGTWRRGTSLLFYSGGSDPADACQLTGLHC